MRPLCGDQSEIFTQGYYPRIDLPIINAVPRRREQLFRQSEQHKNDVAGVPRAQRRAGVVVRSFPTASYDFLAVIGSITMEVVSFCFLS